MFRTYLQRELRNRRRQTLVVAIGMALAIALVILVSALANGVKNAQASALTSVYGVGTDVTVSKTTTAPTDGGGQRFQFDGSGGSTNGNTRTLNSARLTTGFGTTAFASSVLTKTADASGVASATGVLKLNNIDFSGSIQRGATQQSGTGTGGPGGAPRGGAGGEGGFGGPSSFGVTSTSVLGYNTAGDVGPISSTSLVKGRSLTAADASTYNAVIDQDYAASASKTVGKTISLGGKTFTIVGIVKSTSTDGASAADVYVPLSTAQKVSGDTGKLTAVYVTAASSNDVSGVKTALTSALGSGYTVNTEADLASTVSGSLSTAATLASALGTWLSILVLAAAFLIAVLFTVSGVTRRTREFGTLKAIGWTNRRVVGQVAGESLVQSLIGGVIGLVLGIAGILIVNAVRPTLTASTQTFGRGPGGGAAAAQAGSAITLALPITVSVLLLAVGLAVLGGLIAGVFGGWRATRLRPAAALRSVA